MISTIASFINAAIIQGIPLLYGATGEIITEKSGNLNLGIPGIMYIGGISGIVGGYIYEYYTPEPVAALCILIPLLSSLLASALMALIYSFLTITLRANQNVTGLGADDLRRRRRKLFGRLAPELFREKRFNLASHNG